MSRESQQEEVAVYFTQSMSINSRLWVDPEEFERITGQPFDPDALQSAPDALYEYAAECGDIIREMDVMENVIVPGSLEVYP